MDKKKTDLLKLKDGLILREVGGNYLVINLKNPEKGSSKMITLNATGAFLWKFLESGATKEQLVENLIKEYGITNELATSDIEKFIDKLMEAKLIK